jgi:hypothetical protein
MAIPDFADLILDRMEAIDALMPNITIKAQSVAINAIRTTHVGSLAQDKLPLLYTELQPAVITHDSERLLIVERNCIKWLVIANLAQDQPTANGSQGMIDTYAAETVLLSHYLKRPRLQISAANPVPLTYLHGGATAVEIINYGGQVFTREIPPDRTQERWAGITLTLRIRMQYVLEDGLLS